MKEQETTNKTTENLKKSKNLLNFGTLNTRGLKKLKHNDGSLSLNLSNVVSDIKKNKIDVLAIQETHLGEEVYQQNEQDFVSFFVNEKDNPHHGAGIVTRTIYNPTFTKISSRVCTANLKINNKQYLFVSGYAPHETLANSNLDERKNFYNDLVKSLQLKTSNTIVILALDANAKTCYDQEVHPLML